MILSIPLYLFPFGQEEGRSDLLDDITFSTMSVLEMYLDDDILYSLDDTYPLDCNWFEQFFPFMKKLHLRLLRPLKMDTLQLMKHGKLQELTITGVSDEMCDTYYQTNMVEDDGYSIPAPFIGDPSALGDMFAESFPELIKIECSGVLIGNRRAESIIRSFMNHPDISIR